jgi:hypothetical protein
MFSIRQAARRAVAHHWRCQLNNPAPLSRIYTTTVRQSRANTWLRHYLYYSTLIYVFSHLLIAHFGLSIRLIELNLLLICLVVRFARVPKWIFWFILYLAISGAIGIERGRDTFSGFFIEFRAISINVLYYYYFFTMLRDDAERAFLAYARLAFWFAVIAVPVWAITCIAFNAFIRLRGLATEPAQYCVLILPAYYWAAYRFLTVRKKAIDLIVFTLTLVLSVSSLGYMSAAFGIVLLLSVRKRYLVAAPIIVGMLLGIAYEVSSAVRIRVDETILAATTDELAGVNLSTYSLISNAIITQQVLKESPLIGNGLGSHPESHERFIGSIPGVQYFETLNLESMNALEAGSLSFRVLSEFGLVGYLGILVFLWHFHVGGKGPHAAISNAILVCFFLKLIRSGEYFQPEQFFFVFIYIFNYRTARGSPDCVRHRLWSNVTGRLSFVSHEPAMLE